MTPEDQAAVYAEKSKPHFPQLPEGLDPEVAAEINARRRERVTADIERLEAKGAKLAARALRDMAGKPFRARKPGSYKRAVDCYATAAALRELRASLPEEVPGG